MPKVVLNSLLDRHLSWLNVMVTSSKSEMGMFSVPSEYTGSSKIFKQTTVSWLAAEQINSFAWRQKKTPKTLKKTPNT